MIQQPFNPVNTTQNVAVTATSASIALSGAQYAETLHIANIGTQTIFVVLSSNGSAPTATVTNGIPIPANQTLVLTAPRTSHVAAIATTTGSTMYVTAGMGG